MNTPTKSDGSGVAAPEPSKPTTTKEIGIPMMTHPDDNLIDATIPPIQRLRQAVTEVDPALLTLSDGKALLDLLLASLNSDSEFGTRMRAQDEARIARILADEQAAAEAMK